MFKLLTYLMDSVYCVQVNTNFAIDLVHEDPVVVCTQRVVASDSGGPLGHPRVYINLVSGLSHLTCSLTLLVESIESRWSDVNVSAESCPGSCMHVNVTANCHIRSLGL